MAVDPTSPFSGGALLGDRIRMNDLATDPGIFIRSMATRGSVGGLAATTREVVDLLDAFGFPNVLVETVGVGQTELEIASTADTVAVVLVPESGDGIQAMKAGLMEIADLFVINKADRIGADRMVREISQALMLRAGRAMRGGSGHHGVELSGVGAPGKSPGGVGDEPGGTDVAAWDVPVLKTSAGRGEGIDDFLDALLAHNRHLTETGRLEKRREHRARSRVRDVIADRMRGRVEAFLASHPDLPQRIADVAAGRATAYGVADELIPAIFKSGTESEPG